MNTQRIITLILIGMSANVCAGEFKISFIQKMGRHTSRYFSTCKKKQQPVIPGFINNIKKVAPIDSTIAKITYAPNHPLKQASRESVFSVTPEGIVTKNKSIIRLVDTKNGYDKSFSAITLREGRCTKNNCAQQTVGRISDISTLKVASINVDAATKEQESMYGKLQPQKFESPDVDVLKDVAGVISACNNCQRIELIIPKQEVENSQTT